MMEWKRMYWGGKICSGMSAEEYFFIGKSGGLGKYSKN